MSHAMNVCQNAKHPSDQVHHHSPAGDWVLHRHPGCPWDCPEGVWFRPDRLEVAQAGSLQVPPEVAQEAHLKAEEEPEGLHLPPRDRQAVEGALEAVAGVLGHLSGHFAHQADLARQDVEAVTQERDDAVRLLKSLVAILKGQGYAPTFASHGRDWEDAQEFLETIARTEGED